MKALISKNLAIATAAVVAASLASTSVYAADATGTASAVLKAPIGITAGAVMNFGNVSSGTAGGTAILTTADGLSVTGEVLALAGGHASGVFNVTGENASAYSITLPASITLNGSVSGTMLVNGLGHSVAGTPTIGTDDSFKVGGTLNVGASQPAGTYTNTYTVTVNYQ